MQLQMEIEKASETTLKKALDYSQGLVTKLEEKLTTLIASEVKTLEKRVEE
jgi:hypothetical protein